MKNKIVFLILYSIICNISFAKDDKSIYFCTKDIDAVQSSPASSTGNNKENDGNVHMNVYFPLENDKHNVLNLRHCFMLFGTEVKNENSKVSLKDVTTYGYGVPNPNPSQYSKGGGTYIEKGLEQKVVSCVPVLQKSKMRENENIYDKWGKVLETMDREAKESLYNTAGHNCCSVAYKAVEAIAGDLSKIDPGNFNLYGLGIVWGATIGAITDNIGLSLHSSSLLSSTISAKIKDFTVSNEKNEKRDDL
jgi:hypothetical protein